VRPKALLASLMLVLQSFAVASEVVDEHAIELPTELCRNYFFVPITLAPREGYPQDRTLWFLHDTGASSSYVDPDSLERVSGIKTKSGTRINMRDVTIGSLKYNRITARASELDHLSNALGRRIDGILSFGAFKDFLLILDYEEGTLRLEKGELPKPNGVDVFSSKGKDSRPWMDVEFSKRTRRMLIDSGAGLSSLVVRRLDKYRTVSEPRAVSVSAGLRLSDAEYRSAARAARPVMLGPHTLTAPMLSSTKDTEIIGGDVMQHFDWTFDQAKKRFRMTRNKPDSDMGAAPEIGLGVIFSANAEGLLIHKILDDSPARNFDIKPGDLVTRIDGKALAKRGCDTSNTDPVTIGYERAGQFREISLDPYTLVP
jgi:hypothetical protein